MVLEICCELVPFTRTVVIDHVMPLKQKLVLGTEPPLVRDVQFGSFHGGGDDEHEYWFCQDVYHICKAGNSFLEILFWLKIQWRTIKIIIRQLQYTRCIRSGMCLAS